MLMRGVETVNAVLDQIRLEPQRHSQQMWANTDVCDTTYCVAGWALHVHGCSDEWIQLNGGWNGADDQISATARTAAGLLDIDEKDAYVLFYITDNESAVTALEWLAAGKELQWPEILSGKTLEHIAEGAYDEDHLPECLQ